MKCLFVPSNLRRLTRLGAVEVLLAFDFDGTLAPIVADRELAAMRDSTLALFARVCECFPCAVISGRAKDDVRQRLGMARVKYIVGNHGLEPGSGLGEFAREIARIRPLLEAAFVGRTGIEIEDKRYSLAIHYRKADHEREARSVIEEAVSRLSFPLRVIPGKFVSNIVPARAPHKGDALRELCVQERSSAAFYIGDDVTDEDVFALPQAEWLFTVRVGAAMHSAARYFIREQTEVDALLRELLRLRQGQP